MFLAQQTRGSLECCLPIAARLFNLRRMSFTRKKILRFATILGLAIFAGPALTARAADPDQIKQLMAAAEKGDAEAQNKLGRAYFFGESVLQDPAQALHWFRKAADQGVAEAQNGMGYMYHDGAGGAPKDLAESVRWYRKAADQGFAKAQNNLGLMYLNGEGVPKDPAEAANWFRLSAGQGFANAQFNLGVVCAEGNGVKKDPVEGCKWLRLSAAQDYPDAAKACAQLESSMAPEQLVKAKRLTAEFVPRKSGVRPENKAQ